MLKFNFFLCSLLLLQVVSISSSFTVNKRAGLGIDFTKHGDGCYVGAFKLPSGVEVNNDNYNDVCKNRLSRFLSKQSRLDFINFRDDTFLLEQGCLYLYRTFANGSAQKTRISQSEKGCIVVIPMENKRNVKKEKKLEWYSFLSRLDMQVKEKLKRSLEV